MSKIFNRVFLKIVFLEIDHYNSKGLNFTRMSTDGQGTIWRRNIAENFNRLSRVHERYRRQTDDRRTDDDI